MEQLLVCGVQVRHGFCIEVVQVYRRFVDLNVLPFLVLASFLGIFSFIKLALPSCDLTTCVKLLSLPAVTVLDAPYLLKSKCLMLDEVYI